MARRKKESDLRTASITIRVKPVLRQRLERVAKAQRRSLSSLLEILLEDVLEKIDAGS